ncbi:2-oxoacid:acceptor oxidoreductase family protein [Xiamenia xianingshaonis]|uniref:2-oxoacid:acceptor oxidoreductase family protein n=1 Tax=Xiamenia xianingshaonis TaxID=2682776 RepID=A0A9E6MQ91_9ACTN|nr:2-oxoacid:acceptor oxidoreductase family protein [Xiamenia xianingshaonis]NHM14080.1 4Fe-4S dicluster domain-containing protein [Xiamenia xianingshaonis]QTU83944.1 2-oxoacid:acceptor oxidoreductase family protein [Xiamenia xianingshaonis]
MIEVLWHGRGGQGAFTAARLLGAAASLAEGTYALAFPSFGPERRGAPMRAFTKVDAAPIGDRSAVEQADYVVYLDETLLVPGWEKELKPGGVVLVNSTRDASSFRDGRIVPIDADGISSAVLGRPIPNTVFLGALCTLDNALTRENVEEAIRGYMPAKLHAKNIAIVAAAVEAATAAVKAAQASAPAGAATTGQAEPAGEPAARDAGSPRDAGAGAACALALAPDVARRLVQPGPRSDVHIPALSDEALDPAVFARTTCFRAGHLVAKNAGWRNLRPVINRDVCTMCLQCEFHCPDGTIYRTSDDAGQAVAVDLDFCKGCGVCAKVCRFGAIDMVSEQAAASALASLAAIDEKEACVR